MTSPPDNHQELPVDSGGRDSISAIIDLFKRDVDRTLLQSRVPMSVDERFVDLGRSQALVREFDAARLARTAGTAPSTHPTHTASDPQPRPMTDLPHVLRLLALHRIDFVVVGGMAAIAHGSARFTFDLDIVYSREPDNVARLSAALAPLHPRLRGAPEGLPFSLDVPTVMSGLNFTLSTDAGPIDLLGEVTGGGGYPQLLPRSGPAGIFGTTCRVVSLDTLITLKRAAGRPADLLAIAELELLRDGL